MFCTFSDKCLRRFFPTRQDSAQPPDEVPRGSEVDAIGSVGNSGEAGPRGETGKPGEPGHPGRPGIPVRAFQL